MALIEWNDSVFSVHVKDMDEHHKMLVYLINKMHEAMMNSRVQECMDTIFGELMLYADMHFKKEEELMERYDYPEIERQRQEHEIFITTITEVSRSYMQGKMVSSREVIDYLKSWLIDHIMDLDKKYGEYLSSNPEISGGKQ